MTLIWSTAIDWDADGSFATSGDDISAYIQHYDIACGTPAPGPQSLVAAVGKCKLTVNNSDRRFSPAYTSGPLYGKLLPLREVRVQVSDGVTTWTRFRGFIKEIKADSSLYGGRHALIECVGMLALLQDATASLPIQENVLSSDLIKHAINAALLAPASAGTLTYAAQVANNDTVTPNGIAYTYKTTLTPTANEVLIGVDAATSIQNLAAAINNGDGAGTAYAANTTRGLLVAAANAATSYDAANYDSDVSLRMSGAGGTTTITAAGSGFAVGFNGSDIWVAQSFTVTAGRLSQFTVTWGASTGVPTGGVTWEIRPDAGGTAGPSSIVLATGTFTPTASGTNTISGLTAPILASSTKYWLMIRTTSVQPAATYYLWQTSAAVSSYANGNLAWTFNGGASWTDEPTYDAQCEFTTTALSSRDKLAQRFQVPTRFAVSTVQVYLKKVDSPVGTLTARIETDSTTGPSGTLYHASATATVAESTLLATGYSLITFTLAAEVTLESNTVYWLVLSTDRASAATAGVFWGADGSAPTYPYGGTAKGMSQYNGAVWAAETKDAVFVIGLPTLTLTAVLRGAAGNAYTLAKSSSAISLSGSTLSGGADYPLSPAPSIATGKQTFSIAADQWDGEKTSVLTMISQITVSEQGRFWEALDGTLTFQNRDYVLTRATATPALTLNGEGTTFDGSIGSTEVYNSIRVKFTPSATLSTGVVAAMKGIKAIPGRTGYDRWGSSIVLNTANVIKLPFVDPTTGQPMGAKSIITPLVPGASNDFTVFEAQDLSWGDRTNDNFLRFSLAINGNNVEIAVANLATGTLYISRLQVRGTGIVRYNPQSVVVEDSASQSTYKGKRTLPVTLPLPSGETFALALANYLLSRYKTATYRLKSITFQKQAVVNGVNLYGLQIGDVITITVPQLGISAAKYLLTGWRVKREKGSVGDVTLDVFLLDDTLYGVWDNATYGLWDTAKWGI